MIVVSGSVSITVDDGTARHEHLLDRPELGLHVPPMIWSEQRYLTAGAQLLVLASERYDAEDYVNDYEMFLRLKSTQ